MFQYRPLQTHRHLKASERHVNEIDTLCISFEDFSEYLIAAFRARDQVGAELAVASIIAFLTENPDDFSRIDNEDQFHDLCERLTQRQRAELVNEIE